PRASAFLPESEVRGLRDRARAVPQAPPALGRAAPAAANRRWDWNGDQADDSQAPVLNGPAKTGMLLRGSHCASGLAGGVDSGPTAQPGPFAPTTGKTAMAALASNGLAAPPLRQASPGPRQKGPRERQAECRSAPPPCAATCAGIA